MLPVMSYLFFEAKNAGSGSSSGGRAAGELSLCGLMILSWMFLVELDPHARLLGSRFLECEQAAANAAADLVVWWSWWRAGIRFFTEGKRERGFESD